MGRSKFEGTVTDPQIPVSCAEVRRRPLPLLASGSPTFLGGEKLYEANTFQVEGWRAPFGLLAFSSEQLPPFFEAKQSLIIILQIDMKGSEAYVLHGVAHCTAFIDFLLPSYDGGGEDVYVGVQFPFRVFKMTNPRLTFDDPSAGSLEAPINDYDVSVVEEDGLVNSIFYMEFTRPRTTEAREYNLALYFEWEGIVSREGYSMFSFTLPVALGVEDGAEFRHPCTQSPNARYLYYAETLGLRVELNMPTHFDIKQTYPQVEVMRADTGGDSRNLT